MHVSLFDNIATCFGLRPERTSKVNPSVLKRSSRCNSFLRERSYFWMGRVSSAAVASQALKQVVSDIFSPVNDSELFPNLLECRLSPSMQCSLVRVFFYQSGKASP